MLNLDYKCMEFGQKIVLESPKKGKELENTLRKALGVLQEDGVYAMFLWVEKNGSDFDLRKRLVELLNEEQNGVSLRDYFLGNNRRFEEDFDRFCEDLRTVAQDIDRLLFMKRLLERTLTYALYHAKIKSGDKE